MNIAQFEIKVSQLLTKRKMMPSKKVGLKAWCKYFTAFAWTEHTRHGDGIEMIEILLDDDNLIGGEKFNSNFVLRFDALYPDALKNNKTWKSLLPTLIEFKGKGLGVGELYLALVIQGWTFERTDGKGDGKVAGGIRELKKNGASLKPIHKALSADQELLNNTIFEGNRAGPIKPNKRSQGQGFDKWLLWFDTKPNKDEILLNYFTKLYTGRDVKNMCAELSKVRTGLEFYNVIGREVLKWYKEEDKWHSIVIFDNEKNIIANIHNVDDLSIFKKIKFDWKSAPGKDTQALAHGYVNISI
jgi:hypothetical protein